MLASSVYAVQVGLFIKFIDLAIFRTASIIMSMFVLVRTKFIKNIQKYIKTLLYIATVTYRSVWISWNPLSKANRAGSVRSSMT